MYYLFDVAKELPIDVPKGKFPKNKNAHESIYANFIKKVNEFIEENKIKDRRQLILDFSSCDNIKYDVENFRRAAVEFCGAHWVYSQYTAQTNVAECIRMSIIFDSTKNKELMDDGLKQIYFIPGILKESDLLKIEKNNEYAKEMLDGAFLNDDEDLVVEYHKYDSGLYDIQLFEHLVNNIIDFVTEKGYSDVSIDLGDIVIGKDIIPEIFRTLHYAKFKRAVDIKLILKDEESFDNLNEFVLSRRKLSDEKKLELLRKSVKKAGLLYMLKKTRNSQENRKGLGVISHSSFAILDSLNEETKEVVVILFEPTLFTTKDNLILNTSDDGDYVSKAIKDNYKYIISHPEDSNLCLYARKKTFSLAQIGFTDEFLGTIAHFDDVIQYDANDMRKLSYFDDDSIVTEDLILSEYMKKVLNDYKVDYDEVALNKDIAKTKTNLSDLLDNFNEKRQFIFKIK